MEVRLIQAPSREASEKGAHDISSQSALMWNPALWEPVRLRKGPVRATLEPCLKLFQRVENDVQSVQGSDDELPSASSSMQPCNESTVCSVVTWAVIG